MVVLAFLSISLVDQLPIGRILGRSGNELAEDRLRESVALPADLRVPLHTEHESVRAHVNDRFDYAVSRARDHAQVAPSILYGLMMTAVDAQVAAAGKLRQ